MAAARDQFDGETFVKTLTGKAGVYRMLDARGRVLYVGKAKSLKKRVASYVRSLDRTSDKVRALMSRTASIEVTVTHTETEALILESNLIKEHRPRYNILLRDDKSYPYIYLSTHEDFPRLAFHRGARREHGRYFGPYPSAAAVRETLNLLQKLFLVRQCQDSFFRNRSRPCLQHQIGRCTAPCVGLVERDQYAGDVRHAVMFLEGRSQQMIGELVSRMERAARSLEYELAGRYRDQIASLRRVQERQYVSRARGNIDVIAALSRDGVGVVQVFFIRNGLNLGNKTFFPRNTGGAQVADLLAAFLAQFYLTGPKDRAIPGEVLVNAPLADARLLVGVLSSRAGRKVAIRVAARGTRARWMRMAATNAEIALSQQLLSKTGQSKRLHALQEALALAECPRRIECFDISHTAGEAAVASCVVFGAEGPIKSDYRRYNVRGISSGDDYAAMQQALTRRYTRLKKEEAKLPDLLLVDGGKGHLARAVAVLHELQVSGVAVASVAKGAARKAGLEALFLPRRNTPLLLAKDSAALHLIQQIRDEAHRFAITGHRARRARSRRASTLESIPGIGATRRRRLLAEFGGLQGVARAGVEDLARVQGISRDLAQAVYDALRGET